VVRFDATTLWHFDAAERAPSTTSFASVLRCRRYVRLAAHCGLTRDIARGQRGADFVAEVRCRLFWSVIPSL
jgi:hypothetical protein